MDHGSVTSSQQPENGWHIPFVAEDRHCTDHHCLDPLTKPNKLNDLLMQHSEADHARRQGIPGVLDDQQSVISNPHAPKTLQPGNRPLDHPTNLPKTTA